VVVSYFTETLDFIGNILKQKNIGYAKLDGRLKGE
jgi:SNF2 family DNA or RNA helicase